MHYLLRPPLKRHAVSDTHSPLAKADHVAKARVPGAGKSIPPHREGEQIIAESHLSFLSLSFLVCKLGLVKIPIS